MPLANSTSSTQNFSNIHWPVWVIRPHEHIGEGLITDRQGIRRIDLADKSMPFPKRRLAIKVLKDYKVYPLRKAIWNFKDLLASKILDFIDFEGKIYHYTKSVYHPLVYKKIIYKKYTDTTTIFKVKGVNSFFEIAGKLNLAAEYAGLLHIDRGYLLYEVTTEKLKDTKRKI
jgi:hypothetical protein